LKTSGLLGQSETDNRKLEIENELMLCMRNLGIGVALLMATAAFGSAAELAILRNGFSIRHERRQVIDSVTRLYLSSDPTSYVDVPTAEIEHFENDPSPAVQTAPPAAAKNLDQVINDISGRHRLDPDLVTSVIRAESGFNARAVSPKGAKGLMQLMPSTASQLGVPNAFDPQANVEGGTRYLRELLERYDFDLIKALAAYNAGPMRVEQYRGVPPYYETRAYVARIVRDFNRKKLAEEKSVVHQKQAATVQRSSAAHQHVSRGKAAVPSKATVQTKPASVISNPQSE
jgi:soluble lytic murein transglycosylase-like protein